MSRLKYLFVLLFLAKNFYSQKSCNQYIHFKDKGDNFVNQIRVLSNNHYLIGGTSADSLYQDTSFLIQSSKFAYIEEIDALKNVVFKKYFQLETPSYYDYIQCADVLKDSKGDYYIAINFSGNLKINNTSTIGAYDGMVVIKINSAGNILWWFNLNNTSVSSFCFDNNENLFILCYSIANYYSPSTMVLLNLNSKNGQIRKNKIGSNFNNNIVSGKTYYINNQLFFSCTFTDSIKYNNFVIKHTGRTSCIIKMDTNFNLLKSSFISCNSSNNQSVYLNDFIIDIGQNVYVTGLFKNTNLYVNDTVRLNKPNPLTDQMYLVKLNFNLQFLWAKQENQNPFSNANFNLRTGYKLTTDNNNLLLLGYFYNSLILGNDTLSGSSLILINYNTNGQYIRAEKIAGINNSVYTLNYSNDYQNIILSVPFSGTVNVCQSAINSMGGTDTYVAFMDKVTFVNPVDYEHKNMIYPNPANDMVYVQDENKSLLYQITDISGKIIETGQTQNNSIGVSHIQNGIYFLTIFNNEKKYCSKLIIIH